MKTIELTQGKVALVDDEDFERLSTHKWYAEKMNNGKFYATRNIGIKPFKRTVSMHREIMDAPKGIEVDHIHPEDTLDNRRSNLRLCTHAENLCNRGKNANNKSGFKGVYWFSQTRKWQAMIASHGKKIHLGYFDTAEDAARAYNEAAKRYHGEFARLNEV